MKKLILLTKALALCSFHAFATNEGLQVYGPVPGLPPSPFYSFKVRTTNSGAWLEPYAFFTKCPPKTTHPGNQTGYYSSWIGDWSNTYINFELQPWVETEIEISKKDGTAVVSAEVLPAQNVRHCEIRNGKVYVTIDRPTMFAVDIDGQLNKKTGRLSADPNNWSAFYTGPAIHTVTVFANPEITDKPGPTDAGVLYVSPGSPLPQHDGPWTTLYFAPGVHDIGSNFQLHANRRYYIPGDAIVYGTFNNTNRWNDGSNIRIFGHGTLSGERIIQPKYTNPVTPSNEYYKSRPIEISGALNTSVEGLTLADSAFHSINLFSGYDPSRPTTVKWTKIFTWRANGDGIYPSGNTLVEDCFLRTADDAIYTTGAGIRRCIFWNDVNGSAFTMTSLGAVQNPNLVVEDCDVIYSRSAFPISTYGGSVFNLRGQGVNTHPNSTARFQDIRVWEKFPTLPAFQVQSGASYVQAPNYSLQRTDGPVAHVSFKHVAIAALSHLGYPEVLWGTSLAPLSDFSFDRVTIADVPLTGLNAFVNQYVTGAQFKTPAAQNNAFNNTSSDFKWETPGNWQLARIPDTLDTVKHTSFPGMLNMSTVQHIENLEVSHNNTATLQMLPQSRLYVGGNVVIGDVGNNGKGSLLVNGGDLLVEGELQLANLGTARYAYAEISKGTITTYGKVSIGGWNTSVGEAKLRTGGTWTHAGSQFFIGRAGAGSLSMYGGTLNITSTFYNPLRIGQFTGNSTLNLYWGRVITPGLILGKTGSGNATINLFGGSIRIESAAPDSFQVLSTGRIHIEQGGGIYLKGNRVSAIQSLIAAGSIRYPVGNSVNVFYNPDTDYTEAWGMRP